METFRWMLVEIVTERPSVVCRARSLSPNVMSDPVRNLGTLRVRLMVTLNGRSTPMVSRNLLPWRAMLRL